MKSFSVFATICLWSSVAFAAPFTISLDSGNTVIEQTEDSLSFSLKSDATSGDKIGIQGSDTKGKASAQAVSRVTIAFDGKSGSAEYLVRIKTPSSGVKPTVLLADHLGNNIPIENYRSETFQIRGNPGAVYHLELRLPEHVGNQLISSTRVDLKVLKAPILASRRDDGFHIKIVGGKSTPITEYKVVGALLINDSLHCTATLVGPKTLLTAAHCLQGFKNQVADMTFILGSDIKAPVFTCKIEDFVYHDSFDPNPGTTGYNNDIGLVYLAKEPSTKPVPLHRGAPSWESIKTPPTNLTFVGFGLDMIDDTMFGKGTKRQASWPINKVLDHTIVFNAMGMSTCEGDSGGPAFLMINKQPVLVAVTSGGNSRCNGDGFSTRVDSFLAWLDGKIR
jgi:V8-like Glu-specific endopeptidase